MRVKFQSAYDDAIEAASSIDWLDFWFADMLEIVEQIRKEEESKVEETK